MSAQHRHIENNAGESSGTKTGQRIVVYESQQLLLRLYESFIESVLSYNMNTWETTNTNIDRMDAYYLRHISLIIGIQWPNLISNKNKCNHTVIHSLILCIYFNEYNHRIGNGTGKTYVNCLRKKQSNRCSQYIGDKLIDCYIDYTIVLYQHYQ